MKLKKLLVLARSYHNFRREYGHLEGCAQKVVYVRGADSVYGTTPNGMAYVTMPGWEENDSNHKALAFLRAHEIPSVSWTGSPDTWPEQAELEAKATKPEDATLRELLTRLCDVSEYNLPASLRSLRSAWIKAGCPGLNKPVRIGSELKIEMLVTGGRLTDEQVARIKDALENTKKTVQRILPVPEPDPATLRRMLGDAIDVLVSAGDIVPSSLNDAYELLAADRDKKEGKPS